jgi:hypothetical protein
MSISVLSAALCSLRVNPFPSLRTLRLCAKSSVLLFQLSTLNFQPLVPSVKSR